MVSKIDPQVEIHPAMKIVQVNLKRVPKPVRMYFFDRALARIIPEGNFDLSFSLGRTSNQDLVLCPGNHLGYLVAMSKGIWSPIDWLNIYLDKKAYRASKYILACSEMMKHELIDLYKVDASKIEVLLPPIDATRFNATGKKQQADWRKKYGFAPDKKSLLFLTTGNARKGYPFLLQLMEALKDEPIELVVAGVKPLNSSINNVHYIGYANKPEELIWAADALIHPASYEPYGQVITEAIQCGLPVVVSQMVGAKAVVSDKEGRVVNSFDKNDWIFAIKETLATTWNISPTFAQEHQLTVFQHCEQILALGKEANQLI